MNQTWLVALMAMCMLVVTVAAEDISSDVPFGDEDAITLYEEPISGIGISLGGFILIGLIAVALAYVNLVNKDYSKHTPLLIIALVAVIGAALMTEALAVSSPVKPIPCNVYQDCIGKSKCEARGGMAAVTACMVLEARVGRECVFQCRYPTTISTSDVVKCSNKNCNNLCTRQAFGKYVYSRGRCVDYNYITQIQPHANPWEIAKSSCRCYN